MSALVVYFSRTGHTRQVAQEVAQLCHADLEEIRELTPRTGVWAYWRSGWQVLAHAEPPIRAPEKDPAGYDLVVIGTPIWIGQPAPPVRSYARLQASKFKRVAFFCTEGGSGERRAFDAMSRWCGKAPVATLAVLEKQLGLPLHVNALNHFTDEITA